MTVYLHWAWNDSTEHSERKAPYASIEQARNQAEHDLVKARDEDDFSQAPLRITEGEAGKTLWEAP